MAARANIVISDGAITPVVHTFNPNSGDGNVPGVSVISYDDRISGIQVGFPVISISTRKPTRTNRNYKVTMKVMVPVLETVSNSTVSGIAPAPTVAYTAMFVGDFIAPERSSLPVRRDLLAYVKNLLGSPTVTLAIQDLESPW